MEVCVEQSTFSVRRTLNYRALEALFISGVSYPDRCVWIGLFIYVATNVYMLNLYM